MALPFLTLGPVACLEDIGVGAFAEEVRRRCRRSGLRIEDTERPANRARTDAGPDRGAVKIASAYIDPTSRAAAPQASFIGPDMSTVDIPRIASRPGPGVGSRLIRIAIGRPRSFARPGRRARAPTRSPSPLSGSRRPRP